MKAFLLRAVALIALLLAGQDVTGGLVRRVASTYEEPLVQVTVTARGPQLQGERSTQSAPNGEFRSASLPVGHSGALDPTGTVADLSDNTLEDPPAGRDRRSGLTLPPHAKESCYGSPGRRCASTCPAARWIRAPPARDLSDAQASSSVAHIRLRAR